MNFKKYKGLTTKEVNSSRELYGNNSIIKKKKESFFERILDVLKEPTLLLLVIAACIYFILGKIPDGIIMLFCVSFSCFIEFMQEYRTDKALDELNKLSELDVKAIRNNKQIILNSDELVVGDIVILEEGDLVPADAKLLEIQGLGVNESALTGETEVIYKSLDDDKTNKFKNNMCYKGTNITNGMAIIEITAVGANTEYGKIGTSLNEITNTKSLMQNQVKKVVKIYGILCACLFVSVIIISFINFASLDFKARIIESFISGITIAIATIPEEIPVVLTVFLAMGSWKLSKKNALTKSMNCVETLGEITVLCTDKTGTLTQNIMQVKEFYKTNKDFYNSLYFACPINPYDNMEISLKDFCYQNEKINLDDMILKHEYIFNNNDKMMGQIFEKDNINTLYVKGAYESVIKLCNLTDNEINEIEEKVSEFAKQGLRVIAVASKKNIKVKESLYDYKLIFQGLVALADAPREGINDSINKCYSAGIRVIMITGDNGKTAKGIAKQIGIKNYDDVLSGDEIEKMSDEELLEQVKNVNIYARVYPNHKMRIVSALQLNGEIVGMTGDGINDATALKKANIGIAMGNRGTNVAKESADLILLDDNFNTIVEAVENGRCIYNNIKKAISYILAIHIPIALLSLIIPLLKLPAMLIPIHIVLLELLIDPTSTIMFERIKPDKNIMKKPPRNIKENIIDISTLKRCVLQGIVMFGIVLGSFIYFYNNYSLEKATTIAYSTLLLSIMFSAYTLKSRNLTLENFIDGFKDKVVILVNSVILLVLLSIVYIPFLNNVANTTAIGIREWLLIVGLTVLSTIPFDLFKIKK